MSSFFDDEDNDGSHPARPDPAAGGNTVASLQAGHPFSLLLSADEMQRDELLEATLDTVADTTTRFTRATNPLRAPLTLERLLLQVIHGPIDLESETPDSLVRRIAARQADEQRVILVIERAETLHPEVLRFFGDTAALFPDAIPRLQVLFVGRPEFQSMLEDPGAGLDEQAQLLESYRPTTADPLFAPSPDTFDDPPPPPYVAPQPSLLDQLRSIWRQGRATRIGIVAGMAGGLAAIGFAAFVALTGDEPATTPTDAASTALMELPDPPENDPEPPVLQPGPPRDAATAQLRSEFESYLVASGRDLQNATQAQKRTVFQEFLVWRARTTPAR